MYILFWISYVSIWERKKKNIHSVSRQGFVDKQDGVDLPTV